MEQLKIDLTNLSKPKLVSIANQHKIGVKEPILKEKIIDKLYETLDEKQLLEISKDYIYAGRTSVSFWKYAPDKNAKSKIEHSTLPAILTILCNGENPFEINRRPPITETPQIISAKLMNEPGLFSWDNIPGDDDSRLKEFLAKKFNIDWIKTAKIEKIDDGRTIRLTAENKYLSLKLNNEKTKVNLETNDGRTYEFIVKIENGKLNIYNDSIYRILFVSLGRPRRIFENYDYRTFYSTRFINAFLHVDSGVLEVRSDYHLAKKTAETFFADLNNNKGYEHNFRQQQIDLRTVVNLKNELNGVMKDHTGKAESGDSIYDTIKRTKCCEIDDLWTEPQFQEDIKDLDTTASGIEFISPATEDIITVEISTRQNSIYFRSYASEEDIKFVYDKLMRVSDR